VALESQYRLILEHLGKQHGLLGLVFRKAQNKIQDPAKLKRLVAGEYFTTRPLIDAIIGCLAPKPG
jgi:hypothetical protein